MRGETSETQIGAPFQGRLLAGDHREERLRQVIAEVQQEEDLSELYAEEQMLTEEERLRQQEEEYARELYEDLQQPAEEPHRELLAEEQYRQHLADQRRQSHVSDVDRTSVSSYGELYAPKSGR